MATLRTNRQSMARPLSVTETRRAATKPAPRSPAKAATLAAPVVQDRVLPVFALLAALFFALALRLAYLQLWRNHDLTQQAEQLREKNVRLPARRGVLLDRNGTLLVQNEPACDISLDPNLWFANPRPEDTPAMRQARAVETLTQILGIDVAAKVAERGIERGTSGRYRTIEIAGLLPLTIGKRIRDEKLLGVAVSPTARRTAVMGDLAPHLLGYTRRDGNGGSGLEHSLEHAPTYSLLGSSGTLAAEFDTRGRVIPGTIRNHRPAQHGANFLLTLDSMLQHTVQESLEKAYKIAQAEAATAIVLDPKTGDILAMANYPAFDVNRWSNAPEFARINRAVSAPYEPGSTLKTFTLAGAIEDKKITAQSGFFCSGYKKIGRRTIHCHNNEKHGSEDTTGVLANSCNIATADIAFALGKIRLYHYLTAFGFGARTKSGLPGEEPGTLRPSETWKDINLANIAFGQGMSVTPLQLAAAYGAIANDGVYLRPRIVLGIQDEVGAVVKLPVDEGRAVVSPATAHIMQKCCLIRLSRGRGNQRV